MHRQVKNESGYTLLITLGLILMLMLFMFSFTRIAVSQKVQVEKTDSTLVTTALAEMGAEYYKEQIIAEVNALINDTSIKMDGIKSTATSYSDLTSKMNQLANTQNTNLLTYYTSNQYFETDATPESLRTANTTFVENPGIGYRLIERSTLDITTSTLSLKVVGFTPQEVSEPIEIFLTLPKQLMWQGDKTETFTATYSFEEYADLPNEKTIVINDPNSIGSSTYTFQQEHFYHFVSGALFDKQQFGTDGSLVKVNVLSGAPLEFDKHFQVLDSNLITTTLTLDFNSNSQTEIVNSHIIANKITITKGDVVMENVDPNNNSQKVDFTNASTICLKPSDSVTADAYDKNVVNLKKVLLYSGDSKLVYKKSNGLYYYFTGSNEFVIPSPQLDNAIYKEACMITMTAQEQKTVFEAYDPNNMRLSDVIYQ